jgi:hypothetical protein
METIVQLPTAVVAPAHDAMAGTRPVQTHQALAVVCALVCFAPLGIAAVVHAGNVRTQLALGDLEGARRESRTALRLCCASAMASLFFLVVLVLGVVT